LFGLADGPIRPPDRGPAVIVSEVSYTERPKWRWPLAKIVCDPEIMMGKPRVEGTRITVGELAGKDGFRLYPE